MIAYTISLETEITFHFFSHQKQYVKSPFPAASNVLTECSSLNRLWLAIWRKFRGKTATTDNKPTCENAVPWSQYGSFTLWVMGLWWCRTVKREFLVNPPQFLRHRFGHPAAGAKRMTSSPNHGLYISLECGVFVSKIAGLWIVDIYHQKSFFFFTGNSCEIYMK